MIHGSSQVIIISTCVYTYNHRFVFYINRIQTLVLFCDDEIFNHRLGKACFGEQEWYFFSPRERKYPNGERPNRAATSGYWKATGTDKPILTANGTQKIGVKKALVFYGGKPPKGVKTNWIMHEYRLIGENSSANKPPGINLPKKSSLRVRFLNYVYRRFMFIQALIFH